MASGAIHINIDAMKNFFTTAAIVILFLTKTPNLNSANSSVLFQFRRIVQMGRVRMIFEREHGVWFGLIRFSLNRPNILVRSDFDHVNQSTIGLARPEKLWPMGNGLVSCAGLICWPKKDLFYLSCHYFVSSKIIS